jgi:RimJ/RimL family protein N-acetyltransferase
MELTVREMRKEDIEPIINYWLNADKEHLQNMGVDPNKLPTKEELSQILLTQLNLPIEQKRSYCIMWEEDKKAIGHCNTNPTTFGKYAYMHLHLWDKSFRQKGAGIALLKMTLPLFFEKLKLQKLYCEPYALNEAPNKTIQKIGFTLEREYVTTPGSLNFEQPVKRWVLSYQKFKNLNL